ncbi:hypothetical protein SEVIR_9G185533v4 [Setaria viridis]|uniref:Uncharacterized protein n=1 Tax=Setaria viridis TaxID=4556 RepID=A0A4U6SV54_SETVI|nr:hypothetical protein SEVIR_9G185533v2 [Setaria viridis]
MDLDVNKSGFAHTLLVVGLGCRRVTEPPQCRIRRRIYSQPHHYFPILCAYCLQLHQALFISPPPISLTHHHRSTAPHPHRCHASSLSVVQHQRCPLACSRDSPAVVGSHWPCYPLARRRSSPTHAARGHVANRQAQVHSTEEWRGGDEGRERMERCRLPGVSCIYV